MFAIITSTMIYPYITGNRCTRLRKDNEISLGTCDPSLIVLFHEEPVYSRFEIDDG
jgi:hypothetical protein